MTYIFVIIEKKRSLNIMDYILKIVKNIIQLYFLQTRMCKLKF